MRDGLADSKHQLCVSSEYRHRSCWVVLLNGEVENLVELCCVAVSSQFVADNLFVGDGRLRKVLWKDLFLSVVNCDL